MNNSGFLLVKRAQACKDITRIETTEWIFSVKKRRNRITLKSHRNKI